MSKSRRIVHAATHINKYPYLEVKNKADDRDKVYVCYYPVKGGDGTAFIMDRKLARLLAKRINQFLDYTVKK